MSSPRLLVPSPLGEGRGEGQAERAFSQTPSPTLPHVVPKARFQREGDALARIVHPGIARFIAAGVVRAPAGERPYIAMELVEGITLREWATGEHSLDARLAMQSHAAECF